MNSPILMPYLKVLKIILLLSIPFWSSSQVTYQKIYQRGFSSTQVLGMIETPDGGWAATGVADSTTIGQSAVLIKASCTGEIQWTKTLGNSSTIDNIYPSVATNNKDKIFVTNNTGVWPTYDIIFACFDLQGNQLFKKIIGQSGRIDIGTDVLYTSTNEVVLVGYTSSVGSDAGSGSYSDGYIAKFDTLGKKIWDLSIGNKNAIERHYDVIEDRNGNFLVTGYYLTGGTFYAQVLTVSASGQVVSIQSFGYPNHRTYGFGITTNALGEIYLTGSTTIDKVDHQSYGDIFCIKVLENGYSPWQRIYVPLINDGSDSGSSIIVDEDGNLVMGYPTWAFPTTGFVPNKCAVVQVDTSGALLKTYAYTTGGTHYPRVMNAGDGGAWISSFGTIEKTNTFEPLIIKTNKDLKSKDCTTNDWTSSMSIVNKPWDIQTPPYVTGTGVQVKDGAGQNDVTFDNIVTRCEDFPVFPPPTFTSKDTICAGEPIEFLVEGKHFSYQWNFGDGESGNGKHVTHTFNNPGVFNVELTGIDCIGGNVTVNKNIYVFSTGLQIVLDTNLCAGSKIIIGGVTYDTSTTVFIPDTQNPCGGGTVWNITVDPPNDGTVIDTTVCSGKMVLINGKNYLSPGMYLDTVMRNGCQEVDHINVKAKECKDCTPAFPNIFTPNSNNQNDNFKMYTSCKDLAFSVYQLQIFNRWGELIFNSLDPEESWDGSFEGKPAPMDLYVYRFSGVYLDPNTNEKVSYQSKGELNMIR